MRESLLTGSSPVRRLDSSFRRLRTSLRLTAFIPVLLGSSVRERCWSVYRESNYRKSGKKFGAPVSIERTVSVSSQFASLFLDAEAKLFGGTVHRGSKIARRLLRALRPGVAITALLLVAFLMPADRQGRIAFAVSARAFAAATTAPALAPISIDYPEEGSIFPPGITPPTILWRDASGTSWNIDISFADNSAPIHATSKGERMQLGPIHPNCVSILELAACADSATGRG